MSAGEAHPVLLKIGLLVVTRPWGTIIARRPSLWCIEHVVWPELRNGPGPDDDPVPGWVSITILWRDGLVETMTRRAS